MTQTADAIVVGGGLEGLSTAYHLATAGYGRVTVFERALLCSGGTAKSSGVVRAHYGVPSLAAMAWYGNQFLSSAKEILSAEVGFEQTGYVVGVGPGNVEALRANVDMQRSLGVDVELVPLDKVAELWPWADLDDFEAFAYEPQGGYGDAYLTGQAFAAAARRAGATILQNTPVAEILTEGDRVAGVLLGDGERISSRVVIVAAGPWSVHLVAPVGVDLPIRAQREQILLIDPGKAITDTPVLSDLALLQYIRPERSGQLLVGNSDHSSPELVDPDDYPNTADPDFVEQAVAKVDRRLPRLPAPALSSSYSGCYDVTPDYNPVIGPAGPHGLVVCAGFSGHGYKISPAVGRLVADLVTLQQSSDPHVDPADFRLSRFAEGAPTTSLHPYVGAGQMR